jgi:hypothetical protein
MTVQGITSASIDGISIRATKYAISNSIPIVGGFLRDGFDIVIAGSVLIKNAVGIILETAHPAKFGDIVKDAMGREPIIPSRLAEIMELPDRSIPMENDYDLFKDWLMANLQK